MEHNKTNNEINSEIILSVIVECGNDFAKTNGNNKENDINCYKWMDATSKEMLAKDIFNKLNELGYEIVKKKI